VHAFCHAVPQAWHIMGVMLSAAGSLQWLRETVGGTYDELLGGAAEWEPGVEGLLFAPYLAGERTPTPTRPRAAPSPDSACATTAARWRGAVLEGVAFALRDALDLVEELGGRPRVGRISGGGARSELWLQIVASVLEMPLEATVVDEGAAYGAALLGGVAAGRVGRRARGGRALRARHARRRAAAEWIAPYAEAPRALPRPVPALRPLQV
jgi:xylulokinase